MNNQIVLQFFNQLSQSRSYTTCYEKLNCCTERPLVYSDIPKIKIKASSAIESIADLLNLNIILPYCSGLTESEVRTEYANLALRYKSEGEWNLVMILSTQKNYHLYFLLEKILETHTTNYLFGTLLPLCKKRLRCIKVYNKRLFDSELRTAVNIPQRKRGYTDKGHLPTDQESQWSRTKRDHADKGPNPEKPEKFILISPRRWKRS
jgi:hypothetical protein